MEKAPTSKRPRYAAAFHAEALRRASERRRSTLAAARALNSNAKLLYQWQKAAQQPLPTDPAEATVWAGRRCARACAATGERPTLRCLWSMANGH